MTNGTDYAYFTRAKPYNFVAPDTVWQYFPEWDKWYVYHRCQPDISNLIVPEAEWQAILAENGYPPSPPCNGGAQFPILIIVAIAAAAVIGYLLIVKRW